MPYWLIYLLLYLLAVNGLGVWLVRFDKKRAIQGGWRVRERNFFLLSLCGGTVGIYACMRAIRHKTKHKRFMLGLPVLLALQAALAGGAAWLAALR